MQKTQKTKEQKIKEIAIIIGCDTFPAEERAATILKIVEGEF